mmetsp:Transcript_38137/g.84999  ORF Transcript_38137/g.84999 Transcript_38137/m.84999 type:complete len:277 (+) Transcript_38137:891-1721(+)
MLARCMYSRMELRSAWLGVSCLCGSRWLVMGLVSWEVSQVVMPSRSYVNPSAARTGSFITSWVMGHTYRGFTAAAPSPLGTASATKECLAEPNCCGGAFMAGEDASLYLMLLDWEAANEGALGVAVLPGRGPGGLRGCTLVRKVAFDRMRPRRWMILYCSGISISAFSAKMVSFLSLSCAYFVMISVKLTNWKLSHLRAGSASSNSRIISHGPSPTPTMTMDRGSSLAATIALTVACSCGLSWPGGRSDARVTCPSATRRRMWYWLPLSTTTRIAW